ncbi:hypothetical protein [Seonamhaeicola aphaedonensis]|uniref:Uncharacterized protein n=1 Tax=Seonamhaeicola aphaedonensis TaxID=1461338 RepID=A0A3D9HH28_9FLAO|nr:hypothetical protein [Seonamhaeicola aphaedonensis]RED48807.1 hypothetical protein DFQ02_103137 [Seonamhaeicola aphaedonensis]
MIKINKVKEPDFFKSSKAKTITNTISSHFAEPLSRRSQSKFPIGDIEEKFISGKLDYFPLSNDDKRATYGNDLDDEEKVRLLINPCIDKPESIIGYNDDGEILPKPDITDKEEKMVQKSVKIFGLQRSELHKSRREKWKDIQVQIERIKRAYKNYIKHSDPDFLTDCQREFEALKNYKSKDKEHLGVVRFVIRQELSELRKILIAIQEV